LVLFKSASLVEFALWFEKVWVGSEGQLEVSFQLIENVDEILVMVVKNEHFAVDDGV